jgi:hypothetical protein
MGSKVRQFTRADAKTKPYARAVGADRMIWYSSEWCDVNGRARSADRESRRISHALYRQRHARFLPRRERPHLVGTPPNNRVGYFYLAAKQRNAEAK